jgi:hypothetical protein
LIALRFIKIRLRYEYGALLAEFGAWNEILAMRAQPVKKMQVSIAM